jgi:hypothetical protein
MENISLKLIEGETLSKKETRDWLINYIVFITYNYTLTTRDLLTDHDWWLKRIQYHSGIPDDKINLFMEHIPDMVDWPLENFIEYILEFFTLEELASIL